MKKNTNRKFFLLPVLALVIIVLSTALVNSFNLVSRAASPLSCNMVYGMSYKASVPMNTTTLLEQYNPANNTITELSSPIIPGRTRASSISPNGNLLVYYDDIDNRVEWYNFGTNTFGNGTGLDSDYSSGGNQANRMAFAPNGNLYMLIKNNQTGYQDLLQIDTTTFDITVLGPMSDTPTNSISINSILGGDIVFDGANVGYLVDNNGSLFKFDPSTSTFSGLTATYLADIAGIDSTVAPSGLGWAPNGELVGFTSAGTVFDQNQNVGIVTKINLNTLTQTTVLNNVPLAGDGFSCAAPMITSKPEATKTIFKVSGANANGLGGTLVEATNLEPSDIVEYRVIVTNKGIVASTGVTFQDDLPQGTTYIQNSTTLNGSPRADIAGIFVHLGNVEIHSPNQPAEIIAPDTTPNAIDNEAVITYRVKINDPFTQVPRQIRNQGILATDEFSPIYTDNPATPILLDATINPVEIFNQPPIANPNSYGAMTLESVVLEPLNGDTDPENTQLSIVSINGIALTGANQTIIVPNGIVNIIGGVISFASDANYTGTTTFPYIIKDAKNKTAFSNLTIVVSPLNSPASFTTSLTASNPVIINPGGSLLALSDNYTTPFGTNIIINPTQNDDNVSQLFSINGVALTGANQTIIVPDGTLQIVGSIITFVPNNGFSGQSLFPYIVKDAVGNSETANIKITVGANPNPTSSAISSLVISSAINSSIAPSSAISSMTSSLAVSSIANSSTAVVSSTNSSITPSSAISSLAVSSQNPSSILSSTANSSLVSSQNPSSAISSLAVSSQNPSSILSSTANSTANSVLISSTNSLALVANRDNYSTLVNAPIVIAPMSNDVLANKIYSINGVILTGANQVITAPNGILEITPTSITFVPNNNFAGFSNFAYTIKDLSDNIATSDITITIENTSSAISSAISSATNSVANSSVNSTTNSQNSSAISSIFNSSTNSATNSTVNSVTNSTANSVTNSVTNSVIISATNSSQNTNSSVNSTTNSTANSQNSSAINSISNSSNNSVTSSVVSSVLNSTTNSVANSTANSISPKVVDDNYTTGFGKAIVLNPLGNDKDVLRLITIYGTQLTGNLQTISVPNGTVEIGANGEIRFIPLPNYSGTTQFAYTVKAQDNADLSGMITIIVSPKETIEQDVYSSQLDTSTPFNPMLNDLYSKKILTINNTILTGQIQFIPVPKGTISSDGFGNLTFRPNETGTSSFEYSVESSTGNKLTSEITFNITGNNSSSSGGSASSIATTSPKQTINDNYTTLGGTKITINPKENDTGISEIIKINNINTEIPRVVNVANGKVEIDGSKNLTFVPDTDFVGTTSFEYTAKTLDGQSLQATVTILVESNTITPPVIVRINSNPTDPNNDPNNDSNKSPIATPRTGGENLISIAWGGLTLTLIASFVLSKKKHKKHDL